MFSKDITGSDAFREMPPSSQALYFHLGMEADDDGFLDNYKGLMRAMSASTDDLNILLTKRFLVLFPSKVIVVKHWLINNTIRKDRYNETKHLEEKRALIVKENGSYTELSDGKPSGNHTATQKRIEEDRKEEKSSASAGTLGNEVINLFKEINPSYESLFKRKPQHTAAEKLVALHGFERIEKVVHFLAQQRGSKYCPSITTPTQLEDKWAALENYAVGLKKETKGNNFII